MDDRPPAGSATAAEAAAVANKLKLHDPKKLLRSSIQATRFVRAVVNESEGSDHWYASVPPWIHYARVPAMRYRFVYKVIEPSDRMYIKGLGQNVTFHAMPGVPGWADQLGPVAILYTGPATHGRRWFVFRKLLPFADQSQAKAPLLLGLDAHVRRTPREVCRYEPGASQCTVLTGSGQAEQQVAVEALRPHERYRFWLAWSHPSHAHANDVSEMRVARGVDSPSAVALSRLKGLLCGGVTGPVESWNAQPYTLVEPQYAEQLRDRIGHLLEKRRELKKQEVHRTDQRRAGGGAYADASKPPPAGSGAPEEEDAGALLHA